MLQQTSVLRSPLAAGAAATRRKTRQLAVSIRQRGIRSTTYWVAFNYLKPNRFCIFTKDLRVRDGIAPSPAATYEVWDVARMSAWRRGRRGLPPEIFQDTIDGVRACAVASVNGDVAGFIWIYRPGDASRFFDLRDGESELNYGAVLQPYQKLGLFRGVLLAASSWLAARGYRTVYGSVHARNDPSLRAFGAAGFRRMAVVSHFAFYRPKYRPVRTA